MSSETGVILTTFGLGLLLVILGDKRNRVLYGLATIVVMACLSWVAFGPDVMNGRHPVVSLKKLKL